MFDCNTGSKRKRVNELPVDPLVFLFQRSFLRQPPQPPFGPGVDTGGSLQPVLSQEGSNPQLHVSPPIDQLLAMTNQPPSTNS